MTVRYRLDVKTAAGVLQAVLTGEGGATGGFLDLAYTRRVNEPGLLTFSLDGDNPLIPLLENRGIVEVWRSDPERSINWYREFEGLYLKQERKYTEYSQFTAQCPGVLWLLGARSILYYANVANKTAFTSTPAETIMKTLVNYNATANATTANGRLRTANTFGVTVAADTAAGNTLDWHCAWENLLSSLQRLAQVGGGDFNLVSTGAATWEFRWYTGQLGTDRSASIIFSLENGNMRNPVYVRDRIDEATVAAVLGQGEEANRNARVVTGTDYAANNDIETVAEASYASTSGALDSIGAQRLRESRAEHQLDFEVIQEGPWLYGRDYFLGDLVTGRYDTIEVVRKIVGVSASWRGGEEDAGAEEIEIELGQV